MQLEHMAGITTGEGGRKLPDKPEFTARPQESPPRVRRKVNREIIDKLPKSREMHDHAAH